MKHNRLILGLGIIGLAVLILMLKLTSPTVIGPFGVLLFFTTIYIVVFCGFSFFLGLYKSLALKQESLRRKDYFYSAILAFGPIMLLMARSFGVITPWTISLIAVFLILAEFLVAKRF
ncbi:hypothetical protein IJH23_02880 [Candidatus Saccharibacteria bacterium]|nr:hypothetical protein [Candidatus Saccharibacteria bacterium]